MCPQETEPISSMESHLLPNDNNPALCEVPSWADNLDYNHIPALSPRSPDIIETSMLSQLNTSNNNSTAHISPEPSPGTGRVLPLIPQITIESPKTSSNNLGGLLMTAPSRYTGHMNGDSANNESPGDSGTSHPSTESVTSSSPDDITPNSAYSEAESDDEEVEIKPFGRVPLIMSSRGSNPKLRRDAQKETTETLSESGSDQQGTGNNKNGVLFSLHHEESSEEDTESSIGIHC